VPQVGAVEQDHRPGRGDDLHLIRVRPHPRPPHSPCRSAARSRGANRE
jgi:hypothetical protein